ncbi:fatty acid desaturase [Agrobacterium tumefaciens]|uniref:fatty acid desaturase n=1 Tax=Agrobacterium tumefaciens TaxID=358 RepID=UPI000200BA9B|nr:fatty acid desaturase [Agrobacterium tumefaciens]ADY66913.1 Fatty acid desaturase [Agrobacterium tumefaciens]MRH93774.1 fatty acid desaturase [Agrobacterium tumefaciens]NTA60735.1 fatty acid desaturase [Agrobacterium tumefaciens]
MTATLTAQLPGGASEKALLKILSNYRKPRTGRSLYELAVTLVPFVFLWAAASVSIHFGYWLGLLLVIPAAGFLLRLFILQHDCGHGSFFGRRRWDDWTGRAIGILTLTPYDYWRRAHAEHHASAGNLDERGVGDITTLTVTEYRALSPRGKLGYRLYRHPLVMFGIGPAFLFLFKQRLPFGMMRSGALPWISTMATNAGVAVLAILLIWAIGLVPFLLVHLPIVLLAGSAGVWLFYVQHQFEETHWSKPPEWTFPHAAMHGASYYDLPGPLRWITGNIGMHHVHHLSSKVPFYRLPEILHDYPELAKLGRISLRDSLGCVKLILWDESTKRLISLREAEKQPQ